MNDLIRSDQIRIGLLLIWLRVVAVFFMRKRYGMRCDAMRCDDIPLNDVKNGVTIHSSVLFFLLAVKSHGMTGWLLCRLKCIFLMYVKAVT